MSLDNGGESIRFYKSEPTDSAKLPSIKGTFFIAFLTSAKDRNDEEMSFTSWPEDVEANRCFMMATIENSYYLVADSEEDKK